MPHARLNLLLVSFPVLLLMGWGAPAGAQPADTCDEMLDDAEAAYVDARFDRTIHLVDECLRTGQAGREDYIGAYRLLALSYIRMDRLGDARLAVLHLLNEVPDYQADPITDPPDYQVLVESVQAQFTASDQSTQERSWFAANSRWLIGGGAAVVGGILTAILMQSGTSPGGDSGLPPPPDLPH